MSTPPIRVPITAEDLTGPAFASAQAKVQGFQAGMNATSYSMREARGAAKLFSDEIGIGLNRHLTGVLATSQLLGPVLSAAFPVAAAVEFLEVAKGIYDKISGTKAIEEAIAASHEWEKYVRQVHERIIEVNRELLLAGKSEEVQRAMRARWMAEDLGQQKQYADQLRSEIALLDQRDSVHNKQIGTAYGQGAGMGMPVYADIGGLTEEQMKKRAELVQQLHDLEVDMSLKSAQASKAGVDASVAGHKELLAELKEENKYADEFWKKWNQINDELEKSVEKLNSTAFREIGARMEAQRKQLAPWLDQEPLRPDFTRGAAQASEMYKIETDKAYAYEQDNKAMEAARTATERYSDAMERWVAIANQTHMSQEDFAKGAKKIGEELDKNTNKAWKGFSEQVTRNIEAAALFGRSWSDAIKAIMVDLTALIVKLYVMKALSKWMGKGAGGDSEESGGGLVGGSLLSVIFGGGKASGGSVYPGMSYLVGESGPELFRPGSSGAIIPNGALGGNNFYIDARGADVSVEQRITRMLPLIEERAVRRAVSTVRETDLRRPSR